MRSGSTPGSSGSCRPCYRLTPLASPFAPNVFRVTLAEHRGRSPVTERVARLSYFFPAHNEEANLRGLVDEALETLPGLAETFEIIIVDDGSRDATGAIADELAASASGRRAGRPPPDEPRLRRRPAVGLPGRPPRSRRLHRRRPAVPRRGPRPADRAPGRGRPAGRRRRLPDQAGGSARPDALRAGSTGSRTSSGSAFGSATSTAPASCSGGRRSRASRSSRAGRSSRRSSSSSSGPRAGRSSRSASRIIPGRPARRRGRSRASCFAPFATSGGSGCGCGRTAPGPSGAERRS